MQRAHRAGLAGVCLAFLACTTGGGEAPAAEPPPLLVGKSPPPAEQPALPAGQPPPSGEQPPPSAPKCQPTAGGPYWLEEGESVSFTVRCATGLAAPGSAFHVEPLPAGASYQAASATFRWRPGLDQAAVYELSLVGPEGERGVVKVGVADRWQDAGNVPVVDPTRYTEEFGLPVFHLRTHTPLGSELRVPVTVVYRGHTYAAEGKLRGATSLLFPKNSYTVRFPREDPFQEPHAAGGFTDRRSLVLITTFNDNSYVRPRLAFELWRLLSPGSIQVKAYSAVLYLDGAYHGLYTVADHVDEHLMKRHGLNQDGNLFKAVTADANFSLLDKDGQQKAVLHLGLEKKEGLPEEGTPEAFADMHELIRFVASASPEDFRTQAPQRIALRGYEDWWILATLLAARDSDAKNAYHYRDPLGGPWRFTPWDLDGTFGQGWHTRRYSFDTDMEYVAEHQNELFRRLLTEPTFAAPLKDRFRTLLRGELAAPRLQALLDALAAEVAPSARRDEQKWGAAYRTYPEWASRTDFTTFEQEVAYIREWIQRRWSHLDATLQEGTR